MKMLRYYFISKDLDDLERFEVDLEKQGISTEQIHCLSLDDTSAENHLKLHDVAGLMKKDLMHAGSYGLAVGHRSDSHRAPALVWTKTCRWVRSYFAITQTGWNAGRRGCGS